MKKIWYACLLLCVVCLIFGTGCQNKYTHMSDEELIQEVAKHSCMENIALSSQQPIDLDQLAQQCPPFAELRSRDTFMVSMYDYAVPMVKENDSLSAANHLGFSQLIRQLCPEGF